MITPISHQHLQTQDPYMGQYAVVTDNTVSYPQQTHTQEIQTLVCDDSTIPAASYTDNWNTFNTAGYDTASNTAQEFYIQDQSLHYAQVTNPETFTQVTHS